MSALIVDDCERSGTRMELLDQIIHGATGNTEPLANLLRKCLVLSSLLKNEKLKIWATNELNGYPGPDTVPPYRKVNIGARGFFLGPFGSQLNNQPLPPSVLDSLHREWATTAWLTQPIASYEHHKPDQNAQLPWPADLTIRYQGKFIEGYALNRAWQEIPSSVFAGLKDQVRNNILSLALELREQLGDADDKPEKVAREKVDRSIVNNIYGGNNIIATAAHTINQAGHDIIVAGDAASLTTALVDLGVEKEDVDRIIAALRQDGADDRPSFGGKTIEVIKTVAGKLVSTGKQVAASTATSIITQMVLQYLGGIG
jgi:AbiTii